jgi:hypothetical protein
MHSTLCEVCATPTAIDGKICLAANSYNVIEWNPWWVRNVSFLYEFKNVFNCLPSLSIEEWDTSLCILEGTIITEEGRHNIEQLLRGWDNMFAVFLDERGV